MNLKYNGAEFDDYVDDKEYHSYYSQVCDECAKKYNFETTDLSTHAGETICGVKGCNNEASFNIDFKFRCLECGYGARWDEEKQKYLCDQCIGLTDVYIASWNEDLPFSTYPDDPNAVFQLTDEEAKERFGIIIEKERKEK